jgi:manganese efflux pump family protein
MDFLTILLLSFGVAMDAFAISVTDGLCYKNLKRKEAIITALTFGFFQAIMPVIGYMIGNTFFDTIAYLDHWIALLLLGAIGFNMIIDSIREYRKTDDSCENINTFSYKILLVQGIATSIDALAIGISFAVIHTNIIFAVSTIGVITFICSLFGILLGKKFDSLLKEKAQIFGGIILILIGGKIFVEHMFY